jgi:integrase
MSQITDEFTSDIRSPVKGQVIYRDDTLTGFGLRVTPSFKSYIAECKVNGTARRVTLGRHGSISANEARTQAAKLIHKMSAKRLPSKRSTHAPTLKELLALYLDRKTLRPATVLTYKRVINGCLQDWLDKPITTITEEMVQTRHRDLSKPNHMGTMGHDQANTAMHVLSRLLNYAADNLQSPDGQPVISLNPVQKLNQNKLWYKTNRRELVVPDHQLSAWYKAVMSLESTIVRDYLLLLVLTGLRRTEAISLKWSDINLEEQTLTIPAEISKNHREHKLPLSDFILTLLAQRRAQTGESQWLFPRADRDQFMAYPYDAIQVVAKLAGCPFTPHALRRTFCSVAARAGVGHHLIRKLVNHTQVLDVAHKYILIGIEGLREPMQDITDRFLALMGCSMADWTTQGNQPKIARRGAKAPTLDEVLDKYIKSKELRPGTVALYENAIWAGLKDWVHLPVTEITTEMVLEKHRQLSQAQKPNYANLPFQVLRILLYFVAETYQTSAGRPLIEVNPVRQLSLSHAWKKAPVKNTVIPDERLADWYQAVLTETSPTARDFLLFASFTGTPRAQGMKLRWDDVNFERKIISIRPEVCQNNLGYILPLTEFLELLLRQRKSAGQMSEFVFPGKGGGHMASTQRATSIVGNKIGHHFEMNDLRRGFVSAAANCGISQHLIKRLTNHALSSDMTDSFFRATDEDLREAMEQISSHLMALMGFSIDEWKSGDCSTIGNTSFIEVRALLWSNLL